MAVFALGGALALAIPEIHVGPWRPDHVAFDTGADPPASLWRVELAGTAADHAALDGGARSVARFHALIDEVPRRFDRALRDASPSLPPGPPGPRRPVPDELPRRTDLPRGFGPPRGSGSAGTPAPAMDAAVVPEPRRELTRLEAALQAAGDLVRGRARIETCVAGALIARSQIAISGDTESWTSPRLSRAGARSHADSIAIALYTRHAWARLVAAVVRCSGRLAILGAPDLGIAALLEIWRYLCAATRR